MIRITNISLSFTHHQEALKEAILERLMIPEDELLSFQVVKRSIDARRKRAIKFVYAIAAEVKGEEHLLDRPPGKNKFTRYEKKQYQLPELKNRKKPTRPIVVGTGPAGMFAGIILAGVGLQPLLLERGKQVRERTLDTYSFWKRGDLDPESNVQFGEGGAGTFSDGKLYTRIKDPKQRDQFVISEFVKAGAPAEIDINSKPHIGTQNLVAIVENIRAQIIEMGGEYRFGAKVSKIIIENGSVKGVQLENGEQIHAKHVILAIGHSARETFMMLSRLGVSLEAKPFSMGLRIEHPQVLIDQSQFGAAAGDPRLGPADYQLTYHSSSGRAVYSFCMCPGGTVIAAASEPGSVVTNGMSQYSRNERNANSALVAEVFPKDFPGGELGGIIFQQLWEKKAYQLGGRNYFAPVQRVGDYLQGRVTKHLGTVIPSYQPGVQPADLHQVLPDYVSAALREAIPVFEKKIQGFQTGDAVLTGVETRTSSPVRILRNEEYESVNTEGLFPAGEGSGYAGGILSSAVDGIKAAEAVIKRINQG